MPEKKNIRNMRIGSLVPWFPFLSFRFSRRGEGGREKEGVDETKRTIKTRRNADNENRETPKLKTEGKNRPARSPNNTAVKTEGGARHHQQQQRQRHQRQQQSPLPPSPRLPRRRYKQRASREQAAASPIPRHWCVSGAARLELGPLLDSAQRSFVARHATPSPLILHKGNRT